FEGICLKHTDKLKDALGIAKVSTTESPWRYHAIVNSGIPGAQVDLLIDRADGVINLCEMKFYNTEFTIDANYAKELRDKTEIFKEETKTRKNIFITLITTFGTRQNTHSTSLEVIDLRMDVLF
ncbi:MAG: ATP-binding protein, partial [Bacteroidales bacterium]|nr:ATP-binding protein [Bacteroidales bacterium]